jgi:7-carboxy-7-deazaguanine synthase (Cx14CxxC type)
MTYQVKEIYYTLQGEGARAGRPAVFLRFAGCNLWSGREEDRATAVCQFCDTDFVGANGPGGGKFATADALAGAVASAWPDAEKGTPYVVCTGGEPLLQLDTALIHALHDARFEIGIETNGTMLPPEGIDWICVSPKADSDLVVTKGNELKLVFPQRNGAPERYAALDFDCFYLQPMDGVDRTRNTAAAVRYCLDHPQWHLSLQTHKLIGIP